MDSKITNQPQLLTKTPLPETLPPLIITAFARPDLLKQVLAGIAAQSLFPKQIIAFVDAPRNSGDEPMVDLCVELLGEFNQTIPTKIIRRDKNLGCDQNVIIGFSEVLKEYDDLVYLEDDDFPNPCFYDCMCRLLEFYRFEDKVFSVSGYAPWAGKVEADFIASNRVFSWGFAIWADRWKKVSLIEKSGQYNPFGDFYKIPANVQTKLTMINQFWLEKNKKTDWVITTTLMALSMDSIHLVPKKSFVKNIGFGHAASETYRGSEQPWVNAAYDPTFIPEELPSSLSLAKEVQKPLSGVELAQYLDKKGIWITPDAIAFLLKKYPDMQSRLAFSRLFIVRALKGIKRWRSGLPT